MYGHFIQNFVSIDHIWVIAYIVTLHVDEFLLLYINLTSYTMVM